MARMNRSNDIDMLNGPLAGKLTRFAIPVATASILQQLFNSADLAVVGRFDSSTAMAAVGSNAALVNLLVSLFMGLSLGATVTIASLIGRGDQAKISSALHTSILLAILCGAAVLILGEFLAPAMLIIMNTPEDVLPLATLYLRIFFVAMPFTLIYNFGSSVLRAKGDSARPLYALIASGILNVILNIVFVAGFHQGVAGVAIATVISNILSAALVLFFLKQEKGEFHFYFHKLSISGEHLHRIVTIGLPAGVQGMVFSLSNVVIQSAINGFGADCIAGNTAGQNFEFMAYFVVNSYAQAATTFTSQNFAAGKTSRCRRVYLLSTVIGLTATLALSLVFWFGRDLFLLIFTTDPKVTYYAVIRLQFICLFELLTGTYEISGGCLRGMNHSLLPAVIITLGSCVFRLVWIATIFQLHHTIEMLMIVYPVSWVITGSVTTFCYFRIFAREARKYSTDEQTA